VLRALPESFGIVRAAICEVKVAVAISTIDYCTPETRLRIQAGVNDFDTAKPNETDFSKSTDPFRVGAG
jgi:hypothetical protein